MCTRNKTQRQIMSYELYSKIFNEKCLGYLLLNKITFKIWLKYCENLCSIICLIDKRDT